MLPTSVASSLSQSTLLMVLTLLAVQQPKRSLEPVRRTRPTLVPEAEVTRPRLQSKTIEFEDRIPSPQESSWHFMAVDARCSLSLSRLLALRALLN